MTHAQFITHRGAQILFIDLAHNKPFVRAGAVVGLNDLKRVIFNVLNRVTGRSLEAFEQFDAAEDWLATQ